MNELYDVLGSMDLTHSAPDLFLRVREVTERTLQPTWVAFLHEDELQGVYRPDPHFSTESILSLFKKREPPIASNRLLEGDGAGSPELRETAGSVAAAPLAEVVGRETAEVAAFLSSTATQQICSVPVCQRDRRYGYLLFGCPWRIQGEGRSVIEAVQRLMAHICYVYEMAAYERTRSAAFEAIQAPSILTSATGRILEVNSAFVSFFGLDSPREAEGLGIDEIFLLHSEETLPQLFRKEHLARPVVAAPPGTAEQISGVLHSVAGGVTPQGPRLRYFYFRPDKPGRSFSGEHEIPDRRYPRLELPRELSLTAREIDVAVRIAAGESSKEISRRLNVSIRTVQFHRQSLRDKLGIVGRGLSLRHALLKYEQPHS